MSNPNHKTSIVFVIVALAIAVGGGAYYFKSQGAKDVNQSTANAMDTANEEFAEKTGLVDEPNPAAAIKAAQESEANAQNTAPAAGNPEEITVEPGNPVVARVDGKDITRVDVYRFIQTMPVQMQQQPATVVYPIAMEQVINTRIVQNKADSADITDTEEYKAEMEMAKQQIARNVFLQKEVSGKVDEGDLKDKYNEYIKQIPAVEERRARHILVETEEKAKELVEKAKAGDDFEELAKSNSVGPTGPRGGDLGYFTKGEMVPEFANVAFAMKKGEISDKPVKSNFGWHVIQLVDVRQKPKPTFEQMQPLLEAEARRETLDELVTKWRKDVKIEQFDINGKPLKPGANATGLMPAEPSAKQGG